MRVGLLVCALIVGVGPASGAPLRAGQVEAGLLLGGGAAPGGDQRARYLLLRTLGFLVTDAWDLGVQLGLTGDFESAPSSAFLADAQYHVLPGARITPYLGAHVGLEADVLTSQPRVQEAIGPDLGAKWWVGEQLLLIAEIRYTMQVAQPGRGAVLLSLGFSLVDEPQNRTAGNPDEGACGPGSAPLP
ncbi:MAG TPA: hypothetical protein VL049_10135 [Candidatus Dormibacteraeota bacterium]|nr:hypothetical protein [Candidatus Dormibacteraeota bacterium]